MYFLFLFFWTAMLASTSTLVSCTKMYVERRGFGRNWCVNREVVGRLYVRNCKTAYFKHFYLIFRCVPWASQKHNFWASKLADYTLRLQLQPELHNDFFAQCLLAFRFVV
uniref:Putative secreted protein n=1 Tax=Ixodes ricinus TaxID=34613 RepID=A0A6B0UIX5_IXORI